MLGSIEVVYVNGARIWVEVKLDPSSGNVSYVAPACDDKPGGFEQWYADGSRSPLIYIDEWRRAVQRHELARN